jgi:hypothetical protein
MDKISNEEKKRNQTGGHVSSRPIFTTLSTGIAKRVITPLMIKIPEIPQIPPTQPPSRGPENIPRE